jgi:hypothetical protein
MMQTALRRGIHRLTEPWTTTMLAKMSLNNNVLLNTFGLVYDLHKASWHG